MESALNSEENGVLYSELESFEKAQLGNLCPEDAQEARALVPSLNMEGRSIDNTELTELLQQLAQHRQYST
jgi:DNA-directed RNA polymerase II subunit RPB4